MRFFKKRKVEKIDLVIKEPQKKEVPENTGFYKETIEFIPPTDFSMAETMDEKLAIIERDFDKSHTKFESMIHSYYIARIFSKIASKDKDFNLKLMDIDKLINKLRRDQEDIKRLINYLKSIPFDLIKLEDAYEKLNVYLELQKQAKETVAQIHYRYFNHLKIATVNVTRNKTIKELDTMNTNLNLFLNDFKSINEAAQYIFFNSGQVIIALVNSLLNCFKDFGKEEYINIYNYNYFLQSDVIITISLKEWIDIYNKIKFVMKITVDADLSNYLEFRNNYIQFELRYIILMMYFEGKKDSSIVGFNV